MYLIRFVQGILRTYIVQQEVISIIDANCFLPPFQSYKSSTEDMEYISELGNGTSGNVVKMLHKSSKKVIAVKVRVPNLLA